jgi:hypothetical protein
LEHSGFGGGGGGAAGSGAGAESSSGSSGSSGSSSGSGSGSGAGAFADFLLVGSTMFDSPLMQSRKQEQFMSTAPSKMRESSSRIYDRTTNTIAKSTPRIITD